LLGLVLGTAPLDAAHPRELITDSSITVVETVAQNWTDAEARKFYSLNQGSRLIPYDWFLKLEQAGSQTRFADPQFLRSLGYLSRSAEPSRNPDGLPIGFVRDGDFLGLTCAACHTTQINFQGRAWLIDGAPTLADFEKFLRELTRALEATSTDDVKFQRFASAVLGTGATPNAISALKVQLQSRLAERKKYDARNLSQAGAAAFGPGRVDAFGAITNQVATVFSQVEHNEHPANAPVSYPFLWDTPQHDFVQWNGAAPNTDSVLLAAVVGTPHLGALGRNVGEVLGVFGTLDATNEGSLLQFLGYPSSAHKSNLIAAEESLRELWSPQWPVALPAIDSTQKNAGKILFRQHCSRCHDDLQFRRDDPERTVAASMSEVGTDPTMAQNFATRIAATGVTKGRRADLTKFRRLKATDPVQDLLTHMVQRAVLFPDGESPPLSPLAIQSLLARNDNNFHYTLHADLRLDDATISGTFERLEVVEGRLRSAVSSRALQLRRRDVTFRQNLAALNTAVFESLIDDQQVRADQIAGVQAETAGSSTTLTFSQQATVKLPYKGRPLNGIWATAPFLHNGSVPNLNELLKPAAQRITKFRVGSREFDPVNVGYVNDGDFEFDTALPGNRNTGHEYEREFTDSERRQLIEYMKSL